MIARWGLVGGDGVIGALERALVTDRLPPAMLLTGPAHVGKGTLALALARALNCQGEPRPCDECRSCRRIARGQHADVEVIAPGGICRVSDHDHSRSHTIGICAVRRMEAAAAMQPYEGCRRVYIVDPADALTDEAENAFLKTLEEPPPAVTFLLVTERPARLHDTVRSRCQEWTLAPLPVADLATWLATERGVEAETAAVLARLAGGRVGWAITALDEGDPLEVRRTQTEEVGRILASSCADRLTYAQSLAGRGGAEPVNARSLDCLVARPAPRRHRRRRACHPPKPDRAAPGRRHALPACGCRPLPTHACRNARASAARGESSPRSRGDAAANPAGRKECV